MAMGEGAGGEGAPARPAATSQCLLRPNPPPVSRSGEGDGTEGGRAIRPDAAAVPWHAARSPSVGALLLAMRRSLPYSMQFLIGCPVQLVGVLSATITLVASRTVALRAM